MQIYAEHSYANLLFEDQREAGLPVYWEEWSGPEILESEVQQDLKEMKNRISLGRDNMHAEVLKIFDPKHVSNRIYMI